MMEYDCKKIKKKKELVDKQYTNNHTDDINLNKGKRHEKVMNKQTFCGLGVVCNKGGKSSAQFINDAGISCSGQAHD